MKHSLTLVAAALALFGASSFSMATTVAATNLVKYTLAVPAGGSHDTAGKVEFNANVLANDINVNAAYIKSIALAEAIHVPIVVLTPATLTADVLDSKIKVAAVHDPSWSNLNSLAANMSMGDSNATQDSAPIKFLASTHRFGKGIVGGAQV